MLGLKSATLTFGDDFLRKVFRAKANNASTTLSLLFIKGFTTAIISSGNCCYFFDLHSRDERGLSVIDGTSVLIKSMIFLKLKNTFK